MRTPAFCLLLLCLVNWLCAGSTSPAPCALVSALQGRLWRQNQSVQIFDELLPGDILEVEKHTGWTFSFVEHGLRVSGVGPARLKVNKSGVEALSGSLPRQQLAPEITGVPLQKGLNWDRMGGLRQSDSLNLQWQVDQVVEGPSVNLAWLASATVEQVEIRVEPWPHGTPCFQKSLPVEPPRCPLELTPGSYLLTLSGRYTSGMPLEGGTARLDVLTGTQREELSRLEQTLPAAELCYLYLQRGMWSRASLLAQDLLRAQPRNLRLLRVAELGPQP